MTGTSSAQRHTSAAWPTPAQELLLKTALSRGQEAADAWSAWNRIDDVQTTDPGSQRLLPLAYRSLADAGVDKAALAKLKGAYRYSWYRNQLLLHSGAGVLRELARSGFETIILKGPALATIYYRDLGARPMADFDVLVRREDVLGAMKVLQDSGWQPSTPQPEIRLAVRHADSFARPDGTEIDLHWNLLWQVVDDDTLDLRRRDHAERRADQGARRRRSAPHVCVHGVRWAPVEPIRWVADSIKVIEAGGAALDWDRVVRLARQNHVTVAMEHALAYLREAFDAAVPAEVVAELRALAANALRADRVPHGHRQPEQRLAPVDAVGPPPPPAPHARGRARGRPAFATFPAPLGPRAPFAAPAARPPQAPAGGADGRQPSLDHRRLRKPAGECAGSTGCGHGAACAGSARWSDVPSRRERAALGRDRNDDRGRVHGRSACSAIGFMAVVGPLDRRARA